MCKIILNLRKLVQAHIQVSDHLLLVQHEGQISRFGSWPQ